MMKKLLLIFTLCFLYTAISAQTLSGKVLEVSSEGDSIPVTLAAIQWLGTSVGTYSDSQGNFELPRTNTDTIVVSVLAHTPETLVIPADLNNIQVVLSHAHQLDQIQVVAYNGSFVSIKPILTTVITQEGLRRAACCNLAESFESTIAVDMEYADAVTGARQISMLGLAGVYSQILLENVPFIRLLTHQFGLGFVPGSWMESISVSKGVASVTHGYEALTGQIDVEYKKPENNYERLHLNLFGSTMGKGEISLNSRFRIDEKENVSTMLMLFGGVQFAKMDMNKDGFLDMPINQQINAMNRWDYKIPGKFSGRSFVDFVWDNRYGGQKDYNWHTYAGSGEIYGLHIDNKKVDLITKNGFLLPGNEESIGTILSYTYHNTNAVFGQRFFTGIQNSFYANILYSRKFGEKSRHKLTAGGSFQMDHLLNDLKMIDEEGTMFTLFEPVPGIFAEYVYILDPKLVVMAGMRLDYNFAFNQMFWTPRVHAKWQILKRLSLRASVGKGYRTANFYSENFSLLTSNREFNLFPNELQKPEEAYNAGISLVHTFPMRGGDATFSIDYFYTAFVNQTIVDVDRDAQSVFVYNLNGVNNGYGNRSRSHSFQAELTLKPLKRFEILMAYRYNDVRYTSQGNWVQKALMSPHKAVFNINYSLPYDKWKFNLSLNVNGPMRLPNTSGNPEQYQRPDKSPAYCIMNAQITKKFRLWEIYVGGENLLNYKQKDPIIASEDPFSEYFDASVVYAPITGIRAYLGIRINLR